LDTASRDNSSELAKIDDRLHILEERLGAAAGTGVLPSTGNQSNGPGGRVQKALSFTYMGTDGSQHSIGRCESQCDRERIEVFSTQLGA
jgi:hypothetical protein